MADHSESGADAPIITLNTVIEARAGRAAGVEGGLEGAGGSELDRFDRVIDKLAVEAGEAGDGVIFTIQDREASLLQSAMAEGAHAGRPLEAGGLEATFGEGLRGGDLLGWLRSLWDHVDKDEWRAIKRPQGSGPGAGVSDMADAARVAVLSDWGTGLYGAPASAASIARQGDFDLLLHLGDIYYSGTPKETRDRFLDVWPAEAGKLSRALNGNHEMYSGGFAYFDDILPAFGQASSYFALKNEHWLLVGLDTAHTDHAIDAEQAAWLHAVVREAGGRKIVLSSHHQPFSRLDKQGPNLQAALSDLLTSGKITAWYWGHEQDCVIYDRHPSFGLYGRCIGNGGIPSPRKAKVVNAPDAQPWRDGVVWKRLDANSDAPGCLVLDGPNPLVKGEENKFCPHGYLTLDFEGPRLVERIHLPDGTEIYDNRIG